MAADVEGGWVRTAPGDANWNMAYDEAMLLACLAFGGPILRFYSWTEPAASFGYFQRLGEVESATPLRPLVRRCTGGGIVLHNSDWTYSLAFPPTHGRFDLSAKESYRRLHESVADAFTSLGVDAWLAEDCLQCGGGCCFSGHERHDVVVAEGKIAGAAQRRTRQGLLIQGSIRPPSAARREDWEKAFLENLGESLRPLDEGGSELGSVRASAIWLRDEKYGKEAFLRRR